MSAGLWVCVVFFFLGLCFCTVQVRLVHCVNSWTISVQRNYRNRFDRNSFFDVHKNRLPQFQLSFCWEHQFEQQRQKSFSYSNWVCVYLFSVTVSILWHVIWSTVGRWYTNTIRIGFCFVLFGFANFFLLLCKTFTKCCL